MKTPALHLREATLDDCWIVHGLANEPGARAMSFSGSDIEPDEHQSWYERRLADPDTSIYLALSGDNHVIGFARFEKQHHNEISISVALDRPHRGLGLGAELILRALEKYRAENQSAMVRAWIRKENLASQKAFRNAGFRYDSEKANNGLEVVCYVVDLTAHDNQ